VFLIDTGMLSSYYPGGRASALEICGDAKFTAKYMDEQTVLLDSSGPAPQNVDPAHAAAGNGTAANPAVLPAAQICPAAMAAPQ
jgi:hypothetical protein